MDWGTSAALMGMAGMLGIRAKLFAAQPEQLVYEDFDRSAPLHARAHLGMAEWQSRALQWEDRSRCSGITILLAIGGSRRVRLYCTFAPVFVGKVTSRYLQV